MSIEKEVVKEEKAPKAARVAAPAEPVREANGEIAVTEAVMAAARHEVKASLDAQPKVTIRLPKETKGAPNYETVQINGYTYQIQRGVEVEVPRQVRDILVEAELY